MEELRNLVNGKEEAPSTTIRGGGGKEQALLAALQSRWWRNGGISLGSSPFQFPFKN